MAREFSNDYISEADFKATIKRNIIKEPWTEQRSFYDHRLERVMADGFNNTCVLSLTKDNNNSVMWAMYGNRGNGICLEFEDLCFSWGREERRLIPTQVRYSTERPQVNYTGMVAICLNRTRNAANYVPRRLQRRMLDGLEQLACFWTKQARWSYEEEFRLMLSRGYPFEQIPAPGDYLKIPPACLSGIYLGDAVSEDVVKAILSRASLHPFPISVFRGQKAKAAYGLEFTRIN